jgi:hypothetical protein
MHPAAECISSQPTTHASVKSLDVFGNDLGEVDVWGDEKTEESPVTSSTTSSTSNYVANVLQQAIVITQQGPGNEKSEGQKPPRPVPIRELRAELMQKHGTILNSSMRRVRRASSDESSGSIKNTVADLPRIPTMSNPHLPPMTPRTRCRKLGIPLVPPMPPVDPTPVVKVLSVAEKRRMRNEELLNTKEQPMSSQRNDPSQNLFVPDWNHEVKDNDPARNQKRALLAEIKTGESKVRHRRTWSDGQGAFHNGCPLWGAREPQDVPAFEGNKSQGQRDNKQLIPERASLQRSSCLEKEKDRPRVKATQRSRSLSRKQEVSRTSSLSRKKTIEPPKSPRRRTNELQCSAVELQMNLKNLFGDDPVSSPNSSFKNSAHSGSSKSISSKSDTSKCKEEAVKTVSDSVTNKGSDELEKRRSGSLPRRAGRRELHRSSLTNAGDELQGKSNQSNSVPKAGQKIKFVRNSSFNDVGQVECSQSVTKSLSAKSRGSSSGSKSRRCGRRASLGENICNPSTGSSRRHASACAPSPMRSRLEGDEVTTGVPQSPSVRRNSISSRRRSLVRGSTQDANEISTPNSAGGSRRKIRYLKKSDGDQKSDLPCISLDTDD